ncbi:MAG TPA: hypothetical protein PK156_17815 [Polyangium sp.]|nr:hypothetical protein [Polyangium sp.]
MDLPAEPRIRWMLHRTAELLEQGAEPVNGIILPTEQFFPDTFDGTPKAVVALLRRIQAHAGLSDLDVELLFVTPEGETASAGCSSGACGPAGKIETRLERVNRRKDGSYAIALGTGEVGHPVVLTTILTRCISSMFMSEAGAYDHLRSNDREPVADLAATMLGFGVLVTNGSHVEIKGCGGAKVHSATKLTTDELTLALAIFCRSFGIDIRIAHKHLDPVPREHLDRAETWVRANASVVRRLREDPEGIRKDAFVLDQAESWVSRVFGFGRGKRGPTAEETLAQLERSMPAVQSRKPVDPERAKKLAELRALVDESLDSP